MKLIIRNNLYSQLLRHAISVLFALISLTGCAHTQPTNDPFEQINRRIYSFNTFADRTVIRPIAVAYQQVIPEIFRSRIGNVFDTASYPLVFINQFLQGKFETGIRDAGRFIINSTIGSAGLFDVASSLGLSKNSEDFGQTLGVWGLASGPYLMLPLLGPATFRDGVGDIADYYGQLNTFTDHVPTRNVVNVIYFIDLRQRLLAAERLLSGDKYLFTRDAYLQQRHFEVIDGKTKGDPFLDER